MEKFVVIIGTLKLTILLPHSNSLRKSALLDPLTAADCGPRLTWMDPSHAGAYVGQRQ